jgi:carboxymethylenebutenolidase
MPTQIEENDPRIEVENVTFKGASGEVSGYLAKPKGAAKAAGVVIIHENKGLQPHIKDVARRAAVAGFVALAPDFLSPVGGTPDDVNEGPERIKKLDPAQTTENCLAAVEHLRGHANCTGKVGTLGFCWGGAVSNQVAVKDPKLDAGVVFYGRSPADEDVPKIKARMMLNYGSLDKNINPGVPPYEAALKAAGVNYQLHMYEGAGHAFHNDDGGDRHHAESSKLAWGRTMDFLKGALGA